MQDRSSPLIGLLPDQPIKSSALDLLGRAEFARTLSQQVLGHDDPSCLVLALCGPWGSGKSSLLNLLEAELLQARDARSPIVVRFNPWNFSTIDQLITMFFRELSIAVGKGSNKKIKTSLGTSLQVLGLLLASGELSPVGGQYFRLASRSMKGAGGMLRQVRDKPLDEIKDDLNGLLSQLASRVIVLIDDIDRLDARSMLLMMRLIRLNADFNNMTYVLAFDHDVVTDVVSQEQGVSGQEYLKKIVQVTWDIPPPHPAKLLQILVDQLEAVIAPIPESEWETDRWQDLYMKGPRRLIRTPRDVTHYANGFRMNFPPIAGEVNPVDFAALEAIRTFARPVYDYIRDNRDIFIGPEGGTIILQGKDDQAVQAQLDEVFSASGDNELSIRDVCQILFPEAPLPGNHPLAGFRASWRQAKRICAIEYFDRYFYLRVSEDQISQAEFKAIISGAQDQKQLTTQFRLLVEHDRFVSFLETLVDRAGSIESDYTEPVLQAIFHASDSMAFEKEARLSVEPQRHVAYAADALLQSIPDPAMRLDMTNRVVSASKGLSALVFFVAYLEPVKGLVPRSGETFVREDFEQLKETILSRIRGAVQDVTLSKMPHLGSILFRWRDWAGLDEPKDYVRQLIVDDDGLLDFLSGMLSEVHSSEPPYTYREIRLDTIRHFVDPDAIASRVEDLKNQGWGALSARQREAVECFLSPAEQ